jgi:2-polyprenyl-3-methyl-5-hydroxy-6-metoxy-1,4-benzoquinol methylase
MTTTSFFTHLLQELKVNKNLQRYYRFLQSDKLFEFRKTYYLERLNYIDKAITKPNAKIWDCGCGYGTTGIFLTLKGHQVYGNTLEYYIEEITNRKKFWSDFGDISSLKIDYSNLFDSPPPTKFDYIILQDTLHHLEPVAQAVDILHNHLKDDGEIIIVEENGNNLIMRLKLFLQRGNKRIIEMYDDRLKKTILLGNENTRSLKKWTNILKKHSLQIQQTSITYHRILPPFFYSAKENNSDTILKKEKKLSSYFLLKEYLFFGLSFIARKQ